MGVVNGQVVRPREDHQGDPFTSFLTGNGICWLSYHVLRVINVVIHVQGGLRSCGLRLLKVNASSGLHHVRNRQLSGFDRVVPFQIGRRTRDFRRIPP